MKVSQLYLSYAREDRAAVEKVYRRLVAAGFSPWMDVLNISVGRWEPQFKKAIRQSDFFLIFISRHSINKRGYVQNEIQIGLEISSERQEGKIFLIPVLLEECQLPDLLDQFPAVKLYQKSGWQKLLNAITPGHTRSSEVAELREALATDKPKSHLFVAMPFSNEMEDRYYYGIQRAAGTTGYACKRLDKEYFTGDILHQIRVGIETSAAVIADLTGANPNVYLEVGFAWGKGIPTILVIEEKYDLHFDVRGQRCLTYSSIRSLEQLLTKEIENLLLVGRSSLDDRS